MLGGSPPSRRLRCLPVAQVTSHTKNRPKPSPLRSPTGRSSPRAAGAPSRFSRSGSSITPLRIPRAAAPDARRSPVGVDGRALSTLRSNPSRQREGAVHAHVHDNVPIGSYPDAPGPARLPGHREPPPIFGSRSIARCSGSRSTRPPGSGRIVPSASLGMNHRGSGWTPTRWSPVSRRPRASYPGPPPRETFARSSRRTTAGSAPRRATLGSLRPASSGVKSSSIRPRRS